MASGDASSNAASALAKYWAGQILPETPASTLTHDALVIQSLDAISAALVPAWFAAFTSSNQFPGGGDNPIEAYIAWVQDHVLKLADQLATSKAKTLQVVFDAAAEYAWPPATLDAVLQACQNLTAADAKAMCQVFQSQHLSVANLQKASAKRLSARAKRVAQYEQVMATNQAADLWVSAYVGGGIIPPQIRIWSTSGDERVCPLCAPRDGKDIDANGWSLPPAHLRCRCAVKYLTPAAGAVLKGYTVLWKANPYHDADGRFAVKNSSGDGSGNHLTPAKPVRDTVGTPTMLLQERRPESQPIGRLGERIALTFLQQIKGFPDARPANQENPSYPVDIRYDHVLVEVKAGQSINTKGAQQWRLTVDGKPSDKEAKWLSNATPEAAAAFHTEQRRLTLQRKLDLLKALSKADPQGKKFKAKTITCIIDPDRNAVDLFMFDGFHPRISWNKPPTQAAYVGSYEF